MLLRIVFICLVSLLTFSSYAQTVTWSTLPKYDALEEFGNIYKSRINGKVGLADLSGKTLVEAVYDSITPFYEHLALGLEYDGGKYALKGIIDQHNFKVVDIEHRYYITKEYPFFSEDKLVVYDTSNKYGYILSDGTLFKKCQYYLTSPFFQGLARIHKKAKEIAYLSNDGSEITTQLEREGYVLIRGSFFNEDGEAYVYGKGMGVKHYIIDTSGKNVREAKLSSDGKPKNYSQRSLFFPKQTMKQHIGITDGVNAFMEDGRYGFVDLNNKIIVPAQFLEAVPFKGGYAKVREEEKYGVLKLLSGSFSSRLDKDIVSIKNGVGEPVSYTLSVPSDYVYKDVILLLTATNETNQQTLSPKQDGSAERIYTFTPQPQNTGEMEKVYNIVVQADDLLLWKDTQRITFNHIVSLPPVLSVPQLTTEFSVDDEGYVRADSNNEVHVYATITNRSSEVLNITLSMTGNGLVNVTKEFSISPDMSMRVSSVINNIKERKSVEVFVKASNGMTQSYVFKVKPFI